MTAVSAIAMAADGARHDLLFDVAATISRFYPRIDEAPLVSLFHGGESIGTETLDPALAETIRAAAMSYDGGIVPLPYPKKTAPLYHGQAEPKFKGGALRADAGH